MSGSHKEGSHEEGGLGHEVWYVRRCHADWSKEMPCSFGLRLEEERGDPLRNLPGEHSGRTVGAVQGPV